MRVKAKIILDLDNQIIESVDFIDKNLNLCPISSDLKREIYRKIARTGVARFTFVPNVSEDPIGMPYLYIETTFDVFPKIYTADDAGIDFKYRCVLKVAPVKGNIISYERYVELREQYMSKLSEKIKEYQHD